MSTSNKDKDPNIYISDYNTFQDKFIKDASYVIDVDYNYTSNCSNFIRVIAISNAIKENDSIRYYCLDPKEESNIRSLHKQFLIPEKKDKIIILFDMVEFSKNENKDQLLLGCAFNSLIAEALKLAKLDPIKFINTGDGVYIILNMIEPKEDGRLPLFLKNFYHLFINYNNKEVRKEIHFRGAIHIGEVYEITDRLTSEKNFIGNGMNDCQRLISFIPSEYDDIIYISDSVYRKHNNSINCLQLGRRYDKHNKIHRIFQYLPYLP